MTTMEKPVSRYEGRIGKSQIIISVWGAEGAYSFSVQAHAGTFVRAAWPHTVGRTWRTVPEAKRAAVDLLYSWAEHSRPLRRVLPLFGLYAEAQPGLFPGLD